MNTISANKRTIPLWLLSGLLYGLSWPFFAGLNLSFLAWIAFVPLFVFLEKNRAHFWKSMAGCYAAMVVFGCFSAGWLFSFPESKFKIAVIFFAEELWFALPFLPFFFLQKRLGFARALWLFPLLWTVWEWIYLNLEFTMGTHLSAYSQSGNLWLIQFIDLSGMWGVSFWLMLFNVLIFKALKSVDGNFRHRFFFKKLGRISALMLGIPLLYSWYSYAQFTSPSGPSLRVSLVPTQFSADFLTNPENGVQLVEQTLHRSDSLAFSQADQGRYSDLYLWPETGLNYQLAYANLGPLLFDAVKDWKAALLTGCKGVPSGRNLDDKRSHVSGVLLSSQHDAPSFHHKTALTPGQEAIPFHHWLAKIPGFPIPETDPRYYKKGEQSLPLSLTTQDKQHFKVGVSLCFEQWYPQHWASLASHGADVMVHLAGEGWYGNIGFQAFMANVTRMRCIETRRQAARCANVGLSMFVDQLGRSHQETRRGSLETATADLTASNTVTFYAAHPNWFTVTAGILFIGLLGYFLYCDESDFNDLTDVMI